MAHDGQLGTVRTALGDLTSPKRILRAVLLFLLDEQPGHGYALVERLEPLGFHRDNPGPVYRALASLHGAGFVEPRWVVTGQGPARRVFALTPAGREALHQAAPALRSAAKGRDDEMSRYVLRRIRALATSTFAFTLRAELSVEAVDEASARRKLERAFERDQPLGAGVRATGVLNIHPDVGRAIPTSAS